MSNANLDGSGTRSAWALLDVGIAARDRPRPRDRRRRAPLNIVCVHADLVKAVRGERGGAPRADNSAAADNCTNGVN